MKCIPRRGDFTVTGSVDQLQGRYHIQGLFQEFAGGGGVVGGLKP